MNKRTFNMVRRAVRESFSRVPFNNSWRRLHEEEGIGTPSGRELCLSTVDRDRLRSLVWSQVGVDPLSDDAPDLTTASRIEVSGHFRNEKMASSSPTAGQLAVQAVDGVVRCPREDIALPAGSSFLTPSTYLDGHRHGAIVVIENFEVFMASGSVLWPDSLRDQAPLAIYRGHKCLDPSAVNAFLARQNVPIVTLFDFDPAGLLMAIRITAPMLEGALVPAAPESALNQASRDDAFAQQASQRLELSALIDQGKAPAEARKWLHHRWAVMSESFISRGFPLKLMPLR